MIKTAPPRNDIIKFDVMLFDRFVDTIRLSASGILGLSPTDKVRALRAAVEKRRPTIKNLPYEIILEVKKEDIWI